MKPYRNGNIEVTSSRSYRGRGCCTVYTFRTVGTDAMVLPANTLGNSSYYAIENAREARAIADELAVVPAGKLVVVG